MTTKIKCSRRHHLENWENVNVVSVLDNSIVSRLKFQSNIYIVVM